MSGGAIGGLAVESKIAGNRAGMELKQAWEMETRSENEELHVEGRIAVGA